MKKPVGFFVFLGLIPIASALSASGLVWSSVLPVWKADNSGLFCMMSNRQRVRTYGEGRISTIRSVSAGLPDHFRNPETLRIVFDLLPESSCYGFGIGLAERRKGSFRLALFREDSGLTAELASETNGHWTVSRTLLPSSGFVLQNRNNELVWSIQAGRFTLNNRLIVSKTQVPSFLADRILLLGLDDTVRFRSLTLQSSEGRDADKAGSKTQFVLSESFGSSTRLRWIMDSAVIREEAGGRAAPLGP